MIMTDLISKIDEVLNSDFKIDHITELKEKQRDVDMSIKFRAIKNRPISVYKFDKDLCKNKYPNSLLPFLNKGREGVAAICDYFIFVKDGGRLFVLLIELKKGKKKATEQLKASECLVQFIVSTVNRVCKLSVKAEIRKITIRESGIIKKGPTKKSKIKYDKDGFFVFKDSNFYLDKYLC